MSVISQIIEPRQRDLGGFTVGRVLPFVSRRMVGPFIFFDEMGPSTFPAGEGIDVRPHPHIGLATVTYLFEGEILHRDNLGYEQVIRPGDVNWMTAGRGIVHSERTPADKRASGQSMHGIQSWVALPEEHEDTEPSFHHHAKDCLPVIENGGAHMRLIAGSAFGETSPVKTYSPMFYLGVEAGDGATIALPHDYQDRAVYILSGSLEIEGETYGAGRMIVFEQDAAPLIKSRENSTAMLLGGDQLGERRIWWNLVASSDVRIEAARAAWGEAAARNQFEGVFALPPGEDEFIPLPAS